MIITRTPLRISFFGGGTDYPEHYRKHGGQTLGVAINYYSYLMVSRLASLFDYSIRVSYSRTELAHCVDDIQHPAVRECLRFVDINGGVEIGYSGDLPARTGLGSSSSFTVGLLHALHAFQGRLVKREQLASEAVHVERELIRERVGIQDQYICAHGGLVHVQIEASGSIKVVPVPVRSERLAQLQSSLMLFYTGIQRHANDVLAAQLESTENGAITNELRQMSELVDQGLEILTGEHPLQTFGDLLHATWTIKQGLSPHITNGQINEWYGRARRAGAIGGKLLGAGGGGFLLLFAEPSKQEAVTAALADLRQVAVRFAHSGSELIFYSPRLESPSPVATV